ncbi:50S ribosomal protein L19e [Candidatus Micrarchaeota archaeon]|nr:50S ribosomal protein L19e [Candidatus Micrarchaeota archaeon]
MSMQTVRRLAARILDVGESRVRILDTEAASKAITADDVRGLLNEGAIGILAEKHASGANARAKAQRAKQGRRRGPGSQKGSYYAGHSRKERWMELVRAQRQYLSAVKARLKEGTYPKVYKMIKGSAFRSRKNLKAYLDENQLWA